MIEAGKIPVAKKIALKLYSLKKNSEAVLHQLSYLFWECTSRCNLKCLHCGSDCKKNSRSPDMPLDDFLNVLKNVKSTHDPSKIIIVITGGEPLMRKDLIDAGEKIHSLGFPFGMVTNGYLMTKDLFHGLLRAGLMAMTVSLDGLEPEHNWFRGNRNSFERAINTINMAVTARKKGFAFDVITCVNKRNITSLDRLKTLLIDSGVKDWRLVTIFPKGRAAGNDELQLSGVQTRTLMDFIVKTRQESKINASFSCEGFLGGYEMEVRDTPFFCRAGIAIGSVLADGSISACPSLRQDFIQGNIYTDNFVDVWNTRFQLMRDRSWAKSGECEKCNVWHYCKGNALHLRDQKTGTLLYCNYKSLINSSN